MLEALLDKLRRLSVSGKARGALYESLRVMLENNVPMLEALKVLYDQHSTKGKRPNAGMALMVRQALLSVQSGRDNSSLASGLAGWIPSHEQMLLAAGEKGRGLPAALASAAYVQEQIAKMRGVILASMALPVMFLVAIGGILTYFSFSVMPIFTGMVPDRFWQGPAATLRGMTNLVTHWGIVILLGVAALAFLIGWSFPRWTGRYRILADKLPPYSLYRIFQGASFMIAFAAMIASGTKVGDALQQMRRNASPWLEERLFAMITHINRGKQVGDAMALSGHGFPDHQVIERLQIFTRFRNAGEALESVARKWLADINTQIAAQMGALKFIVLGLVTGIIVTIVSGLFSLQGLVEAAAWAGAL
jgi:type II secretory pathway component PulF